jgi:protein PhnA
MGPLHGRSICGHLDLLLAIADKSAQHCAGFCAKAHFTANQAFLMSISAELHARSGAVCELCGSPTGLTVYEVPPVDAPNAANCILVCDTCNAQIAAPGTEDPNHWRCLNDSMWSAEPAVQVMAWRMLTRLRGEGWPADLLDMLVLDDETAAWAQATGEGEAREEVAVHRDCNGVELVAGDTVVLTKDLNVKGANFAAKRGTAVRGISLVHDNPEQIEGRINGQVIVILTQYVKKG